jgi:hypothetical protein
MLKADYLSRREVLQWERPRAALEWDGRITAFGESLQVPESLLELLRQARLLAAREPDRSDRILRLCYAHWLAYADIPPAQRPQPAVKARARFYGTSAAFPFFPTGSQAAPAARALAPLELAQWLESAPAAQASLADGRWSWIEQAAYRARELNQQAELIRVLAGELYRRERGRPPQTPQELVGTYLKTLPVDASMALDWGEVPTVEDAVAQPANAGR